ncbi:MAG: choice-of-anchor B family protein [Bacteroidetes bacterium]|nr:choice-of-anchor B family protein [Bacteroidota bacterium]
MKYPSAPTLISIVDVYAESGYNHSAWLTENSKTMVFTDENHGKGVKIFDMTDIQDPQLKNIVRSNMLQVTDSLTESGSVAHNPYIVGNILLLSYYHDGVRAYDIADPSNPVLLAFYDTYPENTSYYSYKGCWGLYPFLPSGNIIASDITNGLFILDGKKLLNYLPDVPLENSLVFGANPVFDALDIYFTFDKNTKAEVTIYDMTGRLVYSNTIVEQKGSGAISIPVPALASGIYVAAISSESFTLTSKFIKASNK